MRVYCHVHKRSFSSELATPVTCEKGKHVLGAAPSDPTDADFWEYCCDCQNFWLVSPDGPGVSQCPVCERPPVARYLCDRCKTLTLEGALGASNDRKFFLSLQGAPRPGCPGCSSSEVGSLLQHSCPAYGATFMTARSACPFCQRTLSVPVSFPISVAEFLRQYKGEQLEAGIDGEAGLLKAKTGPFLVLDGGNQFPGQILLPKLPRLDDEGQFFEFYDDFYRCDEPRPGEVIIVYPATAREDGSNWRLQDVGRFRIDSSAPEESAKPADVSSDTVRDAAESVGQAGPEIYAHPATPSTEDVFASHNLAESLPVSTTLQISKRTWRLIVLAAAILLLLVAGLAIVVAISLTSNSLSADPTAQVSPEPAATKNAKNQSWPGMISVPGGEFTMGNDEGDEYERPAHRVSVKPFLIDAREVTCEQYGQFIKATGRQSPSGWGIAKCPSGNGQQPVTGVDWYDASAYASWAGKRLPTEEEWEFAARGFDQRKYPWGNDWRSKLANAGDSSAGKLVDVGSYPEGKSPIGALDMVGNAWEWTNSDLKSYPGSKLSPIGDRKIIRGGSWARDDPPDWTTTFRGFAAPAGGKDYSKTGFRCARDAPAN